MKWIRKSQRYDIQKTNYKENRGDGERIKKYLGVCEGFLDNLFEMGLKQMKILN